MALTTLSPSSTALFDASEELRFFLSFRPFFGTPRPSYVDVERALLFFFLQSTRVLPLASSFLYLLDVSRLTLIIPCPCMHTPLAFFPPHRGFSEVVSYSIRPFNRRAIPFEPALAALFGTHFYAIFRLLSFEFPLLLCVCLDGVGPDITEGRLTALSSVVSRQLFFTSSIVLKLLF